MVTTRKENATKCVAQPLLNAKRKRRTKAEIEADKQRLEEERLKAEEGRRAGNERIASAQDRQALEEVRMKATPRPRPRPRPRQVQSASNGQSSMAPVPAQSVDDGTNHSMGATSVSVSATITTDAGQKGKEVPVRLAKEPRKTTHRDAVNALHQEAGQASQSDTRGAANLKNLNHDGQDGANPKEAFLGCVKEWITDVDKNGKPKRPSQQLVTASSNAASSTRVPSFFSAATSTTACSSAVSAPKPPRSHSPTPSVASAEDEPPATWLDDDDKVEREAAYSLTKSPTVNPRIVDGYIDYDQPPFTQIPPVSPASVKAEHVDVAVDISDNENEPMIVNAPIAVLTANKPAASVDPSDDSDDLISINTPATTLTGWTWATTVSDSGDDLIGTDSPAAPLKGRKRATTVQAANHSDAPSSKHLRTKPSSVQDGNPIGSSTKKVKYNNSHIPQGAMTGNKWRGTLIPTYAKWNGMLNTCWGIKSSSEIEVLQLLWNVVYKGMVPATVEIDGSIHAVATQRIVEWRGGFASASIAMIHSLINSNERFNTPETQSDLAKFWLEGNRFLFEDVTGETAKDYKGMWKSRFILQTFAAHMHFIQGAMDIPIETGLRDNKRSYPKAALALAGVAVKRTFVLLRDKALTFEVIPPTGKGKKKASGNEKWKANISGENFKKDSWGYETTRFMQSVERIPPAVWDDIIKASLQIMKDTLRKSGRGTLSDSEDDDTVAPGDDEELADLMTYR